MKRIAILIPSLKTGGAEKQAAILADLLGRHYHVDIYLLYGLDQASPQNMKLLSRSTVHVTSLRGSIVSKIFQLRAALRRSRTEVLLNYLTSCDVIGAVAGRMAGVERIYGGIRNARIGWLKMVADRAAHNLLASGSIYNCYSGAEYFASKGYRADKNIVIPNCFMDISEPVVRAERAVKHIVTVGRFVPQKDYRTIVRTIACLKRLRGDFVMDIIGYGTEERNIREWIGKYGVDECVNIHICPDNVQTLVRDADIYLSASLFEGTSNSIMEALNWSLPVVATDVGDNGRLVINGCNGILHSVGDAEGMARSVALLLESVELRNRYGTAGHRHLRDNYSTEIFESKYINLIDEGKLV